MPMTHGNRTLDVKKLAKVLEMLTSPYDGERVSASERANAMLKEAGLTWTEFVAPPNTARTFVAAYQHARSEAARSDYGEPKTRSKQTDDDIYFCELAKRISVSKGFDGLSLKERKFISQMAYEWTRSVSLLQREWVERIAEKLDLNN